MLSERRVSQFDRGDSHALAVFTMLHQKQMQRLFSSGISDDSASTTTKSLRKS